MSEDVYLGRTLDELKEYDALVYDFLQTDFSMVVRDNHYAEHWDGHIIANPYGDGLIPVEYHGLTTESTLIDVQDARGGPNYGDDA